MANYSLHPTTQTTRRRPPDIIVDPRTLLDCEISEIAGTPAVSSTTPTHTCEGATNPDTGLPVQRCLRFSTGTANVGEGDLWVKGVAGSSSVNQFIYTKPYPDITTFDTVAMPANSLLYHPSHGHFHFQDWTRTRLRKITSSCQAESLAANCATVWQSDAYKTSFSLEDYRVNANNPSASVFDSHYQARKGFYFQQGVYTPGQYEQGIGAGRMDTYRRILPGQLIDITGLAAGDYWLEVEVNTAHAVVESDYTNNVSRVKINIPAVGTSPSTWQCKKCTPLSGDDWNCVNSGGSTTENSYGVL